MPTCTVKGLPFLRPQGAKFVLVAGLVVDLVSPDGGKDTGADLGTLHMDSPHPLKSRTYYLTQLTLS